MSNQNTCFFTGNLTRDAELKYVGQNSTPLCKFSIANNRYGGRDRDDVVSFFEFTIWGKRAEAMNQYLTKGTGVIIVAEARQERWEQDGQNRSKVVFNVNDIEFKGGRRDGGGQRQDGGGGRQSRDEWDHDVQPGDRKQGGVEQTAEFEDDIPF